MVSVEIGEEYYEGDGNGDFGNLAKVKVEKESTPEGFYVITITKNYASIWDNGPPRAGTESTVFEKNLFNTFEKAVKNFVKDMGFNKSRDIIKHILT